MFSLKNIFLIIIVRSLVVIFIMLAINGKYLLFFEKSLNLKYWKKRNRVRLAVGA